MHVSLVSPEGPILASCLFNPLLKCNFFLLPYSTVHSLLNSLASFAQFPSWFFSESLAYVFLVLLRSDQTLAGYGLHIVYIHIQGVGVGGEKLVLGVHDA